MESANGRHLQRMLEVIHLAQKRETSLVNVADTLHFLLSSLDDVERPWAEQFGSNILTLESIGLASLEQRREMGEGLAALKAQTLDALEAMVKTRMENRAIRRDRGGAARGEARKE